MCDSPTERFFVHRDDLNQPTDVVYQADCESPDIWEAYIVSDPQRGLPDGQLLTTGAPVVEEIASAALDSIMGDGWASDRIAAARTKFQRACSEAKRKQSTDAPGAGADTALDQ